MEQHDLAYHERCRAVAVALGLTLYGSTIGAGFSHLIRGECVYPSGTGEVSHAAMVGVEKLIAELRTENERLTKELARYTEASSKKSDWCPCCKQGWDCSKDDVEHRRIITALRTALDVAKAECGAWRLPADHDDNGTNRRLKIKAARKVTDANPLARLETP